MKPLYVIVKEDCVFHAKEPDEVINPILKEIDRIKKEEDFEVVDQFPSQIPDRLVDRAETGREILVCGAHYSGWVEDKSEEAACIDTQISALRENGYDANVHIDGTLLSEEHPGYDLMFAIAA